MSRHIGSHTYGNTRSTVYKQIRDAGRHDNRFLQSIIEVVLEINRFLIQILHHVLSDFLQSGFGVSHGSRAVTINGTEVSLAVYQRITHSPVLSHTDQCSVYG